MSFGCLKNSRMRRALWCVFWVLCLAILTRAQYRFDSWTTDEGLPQNSVLSITQTRDGYLWFTTFDGLVRFDGVKFTVFDKSNTGEINSNRFTSLLEDADGALWVASEYGGLTRYRDGVFDNYSTADGLPTDTVREILQTGRGDLLFLIDGGGVFRRQGDRFEPFEDYRSQQIQKVYWGKSGARWILDKQGLHQTTPNRTIDYPVYIDDSNLARLYEDPAGALWFGTANSDLYEVGDGVITLHNQAGRQIVTGALRLAIINNVVSEDSGGDIWMGGPNLTIFNRRDGTVRRLTAEQGLPTTEIRDIFSDREGNVWLGTDNRGIVRVNRRFITTFSKRDGLKSDNIYPLLADGAGSVWVGADDLSRVENGVVTNYNRADDARFEYPQSLFRDRERRLWIGSYRGIGYFQNDEFTDSSAALGHQIFTVTIEDRHGNLWFGTDKGLIEFRDGKTIAAYGAADGSLPNEEIKDIYEDTNGALWIATYGGLAKLENGKFTHFTEKEGLVSNRVRTITGEADGTLWLGTYDGGLSRFKDGKFTNYTTQNGLFSNGVFRILEDERGNFWMSSNRGIYRVSKQQLNDFADGRIREITSIAYGKQDGMLSTECNGGRQPAGFKAEDGKLWFPTQQGIVIVDPEAVPFNQQPPPVVIESVKIDNQISDDFATAIGNPQTAIEMKPGQSGVEIDYAGLSLIKSEQIRFKYRLAGLDADWIDAGTRRSSYYSYLPPGDYVFTVIAANSDGVWNTRGKTIRLRVVPPFYRTWWFYALAFFSLIGLAFLIYRRRVAQFEREKQAQQDLSRRLIESQEAERKRIAGELHDSLSQNLVIIKNRAMMSLSEPQNATYAFEQIEEIAEAAGESLNEVREIAHNLRPFQIDRLGLTKAIEALTRKADSPVLRVNSQLDKIDGMLPPEMEINLYRIVQESINNIIKHSQATEASVTIEAVEKAIEITIRDNGRGFDANSAKIGESKNGGGFGLIGISERARILGATLTVESKPENGTKIRLKVSV